jgi:two-component system LytT family response regulator
MNKLKCLVIDDEPLAIQLLSEYIRKTEQVTLQGSYSNPIEALQYLQENDADLLFLDVQMPELTGVQLMKILNNRFSVILTTAYEQYAVDGFEHQAIDYLMKPISYERFYQAVQRAVERIVQPTTALQAPSNAYIFVKSEYRVQKIDLDSILYLEGLGDYIAIHTKEGKVLTLENLGHFEKTSRKRIHART